MLQATRRPEREVLDLVEGTDEGVAPTPSREQVAESIESVGISYTWELPLAIVDPWNVNASLDPGPETGRTVIEGMGRPAD